MRITKGMFSEGGARLLDMADFQDDDEIGIKFESRQEKIRIKVDSYDPFGDTIYLDPCDVMELASLLIQQAYEIRRREGSFQEQQEVDLSRVASEYLSLVEYDRSNRTY